MPEQPPSHPGLPPDLPIPSKHLVPVGLQDLRTAHIVPASPGTASSLPEMRLFSTWEICRYMLPVAVGHLRRVLREDPDLPQGKTDQDGRARWFTLEEVTRLRHWFAANGRQAKPYLPHRPDNTRGRIVSVAQMQHGAGKTTLCAHLAMAAVLDGYRVLLIDLDGQAGLDRRFPTPVSEDAVTVQSLLARHCAEHLQVVNRNRRSHGEPPLPMPEMLAEARDLDAAGLVCPTRWPGLDIVPANPGLCATDAAMVSWEAVARGWNFWEALHGSLREPAFASRYDLILIDTPSTLGPLTLAGITAADVLLVPTTIGSIGLGMTNRFLGLLRSFLGDIEERQNIAARALGDPETRFSWEAFRLVINRYDDASQAETAAALQAQFGPALLPHRLPETPLASADGQAGLYEVDYRSVGRETWVRDRAGFDAVYVDIKRILISLWDRDPLSRERG